MNNLRVLCLSVAVGLSGCAHLGPRFDPRAANAEGGLAFETLGQGALPAEWRRPPAGAFRLGPGDKVEIEILQVEGTRQDCVVMPDGFIYFHTLGALKAGGMSLPELKARIVAGLKEFYRSPQVAITLRGVSSQRVWVLGRVNTPGLYPIENPMTVLEAISRAGGLASSRFSGTTEELADLRHSFLVRGGVFTPVDFYKLLREGDLSQNIYLQNGDYIYLPSALSQEVYVLGAVKQPKAIGFSDQITLVSAVAGARGLLPNAYVQRIVIVRGSLSQPSVATVNLNEIMSGKQPDVALQPRDIVWIPNSPWERLEQYTTSIINNFVRTVAANEGGRAANETATPVQSNISINPTQ
jgi:polysaccharide biosynthesis/export protein